MGDLANIADTILDNRYLQNFLLIIYECIIKCLYLCQILRILDRNDHKGLVGLDKAITKGKVIAETLPYDEDIY